MKIQRTKLSDHEYVWLVLGSDYLPIQPISQFIRYLYNISRSPNTLRAYAINLKLYWEYLNDINKAWETIKVDDLANFISWLRLDNPKIILSARTNPKTVRNDH